MKWLDLDLLQLGEAVSRIGVPTITAADLEQARSLGALVPVSAREVGEGRYEILAGAETWLCAQRLAWPKVPVFVIEDLDDDEARRIRQPGALDPITEAEDFAAQLADWQGPKRGRVTALARLLGLNRAYVAHALRLLKLPRSIQEQVRAGKLSAGHARALLRLPRGEQGRAVRRIRNVSVREAEAFVSGEARKPTRDPDIARLEERVSQLLGCDFTVSDQQGTCTIDYLGDLEILDGVLRRIGYRSEVAT